MIDILTAAIMILFIFIGYKNGFLKSVYRVAAFAAGIFLAYILYEPLKNIMIDLGFMDKIGDIIKNLNNSYAEEHQIDLGEGILPGYMKSMVANGQVSLSDALNGFLTTIVINILTFLLIFITVRILIAIVGKLLHIVSKLPIISFFDHGFGVILGIAESVMLIYMVLALVYAITPLRQDPAVIEYISESTLTKTMYENNPIIGLISPTDYESLI